MPDEPAKSNEALWRHTSPGEPAHQPASPELRVEARLTEALSRLADAPVPSNFTARVLAAVDLEDASASRSRFWSWSWRALLPRTALAAALLLVFGLSMQQHVVRNYHAQLVKTVATVAANQPAPSVDALENLEAIQSMGRPAKADGDLLADLQ